MPVGPKRKIWTYVVSGVAIVCLVAGCSSSSSGGKSSSPSGGTSSGAPAASGGAAAEVSAAKAAVAPYLKAPTTINQKVPLTGKIPTNKPWVIITCELPQCQILSGGALAAAKAAGVPTKLLSYKTTDGTTLVSAMKQALSDNPVAVSPIGFTQATWASLEPQYKSAKVIITPIAVGDVVTSDVVTQGAGSQIDYTASGKLIADYVISDSNASAHVLVQDVPSFAVLKAFGDGVKSQLKSGCSGCKVTDLDLSPAQLASNSVVPAVVAALQKDKSIKYLVSTDGAFLVGITSALKAAGLSGIKILGGSPDINNLTALKTGAQTAWASAAENAYGWIALDIIARTLLKMTVPPADGGRVVEILTQANVGNPNPSGFSAPSDYQALYKKLWGLS